MRVEAGDVIGTKDGQYGKVVEVVSQERFLVNLFPDTEGFVPDPPQLWASLDDVASIV